MEETGYKFNNRGATTMLDPAQSKHWRFERQTDLRRSDFKDDGPDGLTPGDVLAFCVTAVIAVLLWYGVL
jgi:hypothetical protein